MPDGSDAQLASVDAALDLWHSRGVTGLDRGNAAQLTVRFRDAADAVYGFYDETTATVLVNLRIDDADQRTITIAHELGHALGLVHVSPDERSSVMNPGNVTIQPTADDAIALARLWGACM